MHARRALLFLAILAFASSPLASQESRAPAPPSADSAGWALLAPGRLRQGDPLLAWLIGASPAAGDPRPSVRLVNASGKTVSTARCFDATTMLGGDSPRPGVSLFGALMAIPTDLPPGAYSLVAAAATAAVSIEVRNFALETIPLNEANTNLRTKPSKRKTDEALRLYSILDSVDADAVLADGRSFAFPVQGGWKSADFGDVRRYVYSDGSSARSVHEGIDRAVVTGTPVSACARGKVVLAAEREVTGYSLIIEHLPGLYSLYFHLSSIEVKEGAIVERGEELGRSGSTGMATGPHLHWELRAAGLAVDPAYWLDVPLLDKAAVTAIIDGLIEGR